MPLEFVFPIECLFADIALERSVVSMNQHVHLQILFGLERLVAL